jgi:hypothetical protein
MSDRYDYKLVLFNVKRMARLRKQGWAVAAQFDGDLMLMERVR